MKTIGAITLCWGLYAFAGLGAVVAQTDGPPPLPAGPLLRKPADFSAWEMTYTYDADKQKGSANPAPPKPTVFRLGTVSTAPPQQVILTTTKPFWHAAVLTRDGQNIQEWSDGTDQYFSADGLPGAMQVPKNMSGVGIIPNFGAIGFPDMTWVSAATYSGVEPIGGHPCLVFKKDDMTAWIDQESRYPVQWQRGGELRTFRQLARPAGTLEPPPEVVKLIQANKRRLQIINTPPPKGG